MSIKLITLDLDDTLWPVDDVITRAEAIYYDFLCKQAPELFTKLDKEDLRNYRLQHLKKHPELQHDISRWRLDSLSCQLQEAGLNAVQAQQLSEQSFEVFLEARQDVALFPHAEQVLAELSGKYRLIAVTNGNADVNRMPIGPYFFGAFRAEDLKISKPAPELFEAALEAAGVTAAQTLHIGDDPYYDIEPAMALGMHTLQACITDKHPATGPAFSDWRQVPRQIQQLDQTER
ncbi:putative hydrolase of the HAD superfamily [Litorivivens lipolytica]|uniref:Putative hydrolase of the HAD superfamily n=1 Tax=Litorivivens lipolytica TaxID=1524264 RepID=A0A7W4W6N8_9GAMM|nr:HAD family hydrolase [Litorivivens lipolytica]MBB3048429.1 putative hydrolase of the HAD superfamily [Litorivivens lipolytica]